MNVQKIRATVIVIALVLIGADPLTASAQDWANMNRFKEENTMLQKAPQNNSRVVFMGDSITEAWSRIMPSFFEGKPYVNRGISGQTTPQMLVRFRADVIDLKPAVVLILAGTNDIAGNTGPIELPEIAGNIASMAELARAHNIQVVICAVLPAADYPWQPGLSPDQKIPVLNGMLKDYAKKEGFLYLDYFAEMTDGENGMRANLGSDGVHPNEIGYNIMGPMVDEVIEQALSISR